MSECVCVCVCVLKDILTRNLHTLGQHTESIASLLLSSHVLAGILWLMEQLFQQETRKTKHVCGKMH